ncbi:hypothetical protein B0H13DRAFT_2306511 [Mycena leptocephala]|nr:hypothetical protein B0H13DRAFT_2306511 [Mycena leptocephala]
MATFGSKSATFTNNRKMKRTNMSVPTTHAKVLPQLGWLYHQDGFSFQKQDLAIQYITKSLEAEVQQAYEAYQQAVYRNSWNPTFWCSIGVLYFQINQYRDALDAYSCAIRINPYILEVWFDLVSLYESCNNQISVPKELRINCHSSTIDGPSLQKCIAL